MDKKEARQAVLKILDTHCTPCTRTNGLYSERKNKFCRDNCSVYKELRSYGKILYEEKRTEPLEEPENQGRWSEEEELYLMAHVGIFSIKHIAKKLDRSIKSVYAKYYYLKKTSNSAK